MNWLVGYGLLKVSKLLSNRVQGAKDSIVSVGGLGYKNGKILKKDCCSLHCEILHNEPKK